VTLVTRPVSLERLTGFYAKVRPGGFWGPAAAARPDVQGDGLTLRRLGVWAAGCAGVYGLLFGIGKLVLGQTGPALPLGLLALAGGVVVARELRR
jgi:hypothetical protein